MTRPLLRQLRTRVEAIKAGCRAYRCREQAVERT